MGPWCSRWAPATTNSPQSEAVARRAPLYHTRPFPRYTGQNRGEDVHRFVNESFEPDRRGHDLTGIGRELGGFTHRAKGKEKG